MFDYRKLKGRIIERFGSQKEFAKAYGTAENTISRKLSGKRKITTDDITKMCRPEFLDIPVQEIPVYFFKEKVQEIEQSESA